MSGSQKGQPIKGGPKEDTRLQVEQQVTFSPDLLQEDVKVPLVFNGHRLIYCFNLNTALCGEGYEFIADMLLGLFSLQRHANHEGVGLVANCATVRHHRKLIYGTFTTCIAATAAS